MVVKYHYTDEPISKLLAIIVAAVPNGMLQEAYNPSATDTIWRAGRNAPTRGEVFRVKLVFSALKAKMSGVFNISRCRMSRQHQHLNQVQTIVDGSSPLGGDAFPWDE